MPVDRNPRPHLRPQWRRHDLERAVADMARALGWTVFVVMPHGSRGRAAGVGGHATGRHPLMLVHPVQQRLVVVQLDPRSVGIMPVEAAQTFTAFKRRLDQLDPAARDPDPSFSGIEVHVWGPDDVDAGVVAATLSQRPNGSSRRVA